MVGGLPWWLSGEESTCQCRRHWFDPWSRKIPHAVEQLSQCHNYRACALEPHKRSHCNEKSLHSNREQSQKQINAIYIWSHHFMANRWGNNGNSEKTGNSEGSKITADGDCSHEIKRDLLLGRKVLANLAAY